MAQIKGDLLKRTGKSKIEVVKQLLWRILNRMLIEGNDRKDILRIRGGWELQ